MSSEILYRATNQDKSSRNTKHQQRSPPRKRSKVASNMKDDARDSLVEFQSSIFDASDGHQLVDFIRKKKGLRSQQQTIFDDVRTDRQSLQIEIQRLNENENTLRLEEPEELISADDIKKEVQSTEAENTNVPNAPQSPRRPTYIESKLKLKRLSHSIGRRTLLKEFERTLQDSRFLPPICSTPVTVDPPNLPVTPTNTANEKTLSKAVSVAQEKPLNLNLVCTPITISDEDSPAQTVSKEPSTQNQTLTSSNNTENVMRVLQDQNDFLLELANSDEDIPCRSQVSPEPHNPFCDKENPIKSPARNSSTPIKKTHRQTYTVHRSTRSGNLILSPNKSRHENSVVQPMLPKTPLKNQQNNTRKLIVTPEQKKLLLSKFGRQASAQKTSRIPVIMKGTTVNTPSIECQNVEGANVTFQVTEQRETAHIIEQLQKRAPSNAPVIVIPVNQTFNQLPRTSKQVVSKPPPSTNSQNSNEIISTTTTTTRTVPQHETVKAPSSNNEVPTSVSKLRLADIITEDESSSSDDNQPLTRTRKLKEQKSSNTSTNQTLSTRHENELSLRAPPPRNSGRHLRKLMTPYQLSQLSVGDILDLRKRNSRGELQKTLNLSKRESSMLDKQVELELLRRNIQEENYEDEVLQMEVLPPPPEDFCDNRKDLKSLHKTLQLEAPTFEDDFVDENSTDRISLSQEPMPRSSISQKGRGRRIKKKMSEQMEKYLQASQTVSKSKYLNLSKRKLYSKGNSDVSSSNDSSLSMTPPRRASRKTSKTPVKPNKHVSRISNNFQETPAILTSSPPHHISPPADFANKSREKQPFLPNEKDMFKKPIGRPPQKSKTKPKSAAVSKGKKNTIPSHASSPTPHPPVDPDETHNTNSNLDGTSTIRRSKRGRKPLKAFWSCTKTEYISPYDFYQYLATKRDESMAKQKAKAKRNKASNVSNRKDNLVANTKKTKSNSIDKAQGEKNSDKKHESKQIKRKEEKSKQLADGAASSSDCPSTSSSIYVRQRRNSSRRLSGSENLNSEHAKSKPTQDSNTFPSESNSKDLPAQLPTIGEEATPVTHRTSKILKEHPKSKSKKDRTLATDSCESSSKDDNPLPSNITKNSVHNKEKPTRLTSKEAKSKKKLTSTNSQTPSNDCISENSSSSIQQKRLTTIVEDSAHGLSLQTTIAVNDLDKAHGNRLSTTLMPPPPSQVVKESAQPLTITKNSLRHIEKSTASQSKGAKSKKRHCSIDSQTSISDCPSEDYPSSIQQIRLATIAEDSLPGLDQQPAISVSDFDKTNKNRSSTTLMPPPASTVVRKNQKTSKKTRKDAFRTEHDESIADASSLHVNKLFDQMKNSSTCVAAEDTTHPVNSGQVSLSSLAKERNAKETNCKQLTVRLLRMKKRKTLPESSEKICDSGFSSEDMSSDPKQRGDILLNWLRQIVKNDKSTQTGVARFLQADGFRAASVDDLIFQEIDGVDYAFYNTKVQYSFGYIRFNPKTEKKKVTAKKFELNFIVLYGVVMITANDNTFDCKNGDLITVFIGTKYEIKNISNDPALVMVIKK